MILISTEEGSDQFQLRTELQHSAVDLGIGQGGPRAENWNTLTLEMDLF